jgi:hypothetical protein
VHEVAAGHGSMVLKAELFVPALVEAVGSVRDRLRSQVAQAQAR